MEETKGDGDIEPANERDAVYEYSLDPDTRAAEKKLRRVVAKQVELRKPGVPTSLVPRKAS